MNARRARAGGGSEEKKARWTGHARPNQKMNGGLAALGAFGHDSQQHRGRPPHAASHRSTFIVASVSRPSTFFPSALSPPFETVARRHDVSPRDLFAPSSNDVRRRCCATGDERRARDRRRVVAGRREPRHGLEREVAPLAFFAFKCRRTVVGHRPATSDDGRRGTQSIRHANGSESTKRGQIPSCAPRPHSP